MQLQDKSPKGHKRRLTVCLNALECCCLILKPKWLWSWEAVAEGQAVLVLKALGQEALLLQALPVPP